MIEKFEFACNNLFVNSLPKIKYGDYTRNIITEFITIVCIMTSMMATFLFYADGYFVGYVMVKQ